MPVPIYYVGTPQEVEHHARPLTGSFDVRIEDAEETVRLARPGDVCVFFNEFFSRFRLAIHELRRKQCAVLYAIDGILEWRSMWEFPESLATLWTGRPILSHKVACVGRSQARIFESWGHADECEIVGLPRLDSLLGRTPRVRPQGEPFTILVLTAKWPGFTQEQWDRASHSLRDLKAWLDARPLVDGTPVRSVWRITQGLEQEVGVDNSLRDTTGKDLADALARADAVVTTPSTAMLEGMLQGLPVALLDYNNCPHYVPAAWRITAPTHFDQVIPELVSPSPAKMVYQQHLLRDSLESSSPALPRLVALVQQMDAMAKQALRDGVELRFPPRLLAGPEGSSAAESVSPSLAHLYPANPAFSETSQHRLQAEVGDLRAALAEHQAASARDARAVREALAALGQQVADQQAAIARRRRIRDIPKRMVRKIFPKQEKPIRRVA